MALVRSQLAMMIRKNGHLILEGDETTDELRTALMYLSVCHGQADCHRPGLGIPIDILLPNTNALVERSPRRPPAKKRIVDIKSERL